MSILVSIYMYFKPSSCTVIGDADDTVCCVQLVSFLFPFFSGKYFIFIPSEVIVTRKQPLIALVLHYCDRYCFVPGKKCGSPREMGSATSPSAKSFRWVIEIEKQRWLLADWKVTVYAHLCFINRKKNCNDKHTETMTARISTET